METQARTLEQTIARLDAPDPYARERYPHTPRAVLELAREMRGMHSKPAINLQVRTARILDGLRRVEWRPQLTELSRATGMKTSTTWDMLRRLRKYGMYAEIKLHVPGGPVLEFRA